MDLSPTEMLQVVISDHCRAYLRGLLNIRMHGNEGLPDTDWCHHVTIYHPLNPDAAGSPSPFDVLLPGDEALVRPIGRIRTPKVDALVVSLSFPRLGMRASYQAGGRRPLHVVIGCAAGVQPVACHDAIRNGMVSPVRFAHDLDGVVTIVESATKGKR